MPMRFGTIGKNFISREFRKAGEKLEGFSLAVVYSRTVETARAFAGEDAIACTDSLQELASREDVDAVYIASPNKFHYEQAAQMLRAGKHVLLEKPMTVTLEEAKAIMEAEKKSGKIVSVARLTALARENGVVLLEAMRSVFTPGFRALREAVDKVGKVRRVSFTYCQYSSRYDAYKRGVVENAFDPAKGSTKPCSIICVETCSSSISIWCTIARR